MVSMTPISEWLAQTSLSQAIAGSAWAVPTLQSIHITGAQQPLRSNVVRFYPWIWRALLVLVTTGFFQIMAEPARELLNWIFWIKMSLVIAACLVTAPTRSRVEEVRFADMAPAKRSMIRVIALVSLVLWVAVITCGRWIAYAGGPAS
jgi:hypothetical protein